MTNTSKPFNFTKFAGFAVLAAVLNGISFLIGKATDATMMVDQGDLREIALPMVFAATLFPLLMAGAVTFGIGKNSPKFVSKAALIGGIFGVVTLFAPFLVAQDTGTGITLASNHVIAGIIWYVGIKKSIKA